MTINQIKALAEKATPGEWRAVRGRYGCPELGRYIVINDQVDGDWHQIRSDREPSETETDFVFIAAAANNILPLINLLEEAELTLDAVRQWFEAEDKAGRFVPPLTVGRTATTLAKIKDMRGE